MKMWDVTVVGEIYIDHVMSGFEAWPRPGEEVVTDRYTREIGGGAAITACGLARLGRSVNLIGVVGQDDLPWLRNRLLQFGVPGHELHPVADSTGVTLSVSTREDRSFFTHSGANRHLTQQLLAPSALASLTGARHVHFAMPLPRAPATKVLPMLAQAACTTSLDVGYQPAWLTDKTHEATWQAIDYLLPNEKEAALLSGGASAGDFFAFARKSSLRNSVLKLGARGAMSNVNDRIVHVSPPQVDAVDSTGSGDAFDAGFIDALLDDAGMEERLRRACICGALSTRVAGALGGLADRDELRRVYERTYGS
jgi:sugar/nucleoside kinase (ribokinase family)